MAESSGLRAAICTMGCKVNSYESAKMAKQLSEAGFALVDFKDPADVYIINTCTVTQVAAKKSRQMIHRARKLSPSALVIAAGCYVDRDDSLIREGVIDLAVSNQDKDRLIPRIEAALAKGPLAQAPSPEESVDRSAFLEEHGFTEHARAFIKVQDGCRQFCTYCIIPYVRGPLKSRPVEDIVQEVEGLVSQGFREVVITGIHLSSYGLDWEETSYNRAQSEGMFLGNHLSDLILSLEKIHGLERIRLGSLEPRLITEEFVSRIRESRKLCPHFHLSLQSGCDRTLKAMNRHYTAEDYLQAVALLREAFEDPCITTDVISGFPGETEEDHLESLAFLKKVSFAEAHVFPYSRMEGTVAARMADQVPQDVKKKRAHQLLEVTAVSSEAYMNSMQGRILEVLMEQKDEETGLWVGTSKNYLRVAVDRECVQGEILFCRIVGKANIRSANHSASGLDTILQGQVTS